MRIFIAISIIGWLLAGCNTAKKPIESTQSIDYLKTETKAQFDQRMAWWRDARFGLFIHWGLYAVPAGEWKGQTDHAEWIRTTAEIPLKEYDQFVGQFNPQKFNADEWVRLAKAAGMKYIVITSKHHDGFDLFDADNSDFDVMATPFHRDVLKELAEACKKGGIRLCFYHSIMDWHHPDYLPRRGWEKDRPTDGADFSRYVQYMKAQLKEITTQYGDIGVLWFDGEWEDTWTHEQGEDLYNYVRNLKPDIIINNRVDVGRNGMEGMTRRDGSFAGDFGTPEQEIPDTGLPGVDWESCMTMNDHWGYNKNDHNWKSAEDLIKNLVDIASKGGNFLLNIGPTAEGVFPPESIERLEAIGKWMDVNGEAIHGTKASPFSHLPWGRATQKPGDKTSIIYLHIFDYQRNAPIRLPGIVNKPIKAYFLVDRTKEIPVTREEDALLLQLPRQAPDISVPVVALEIEGSPEVYPAPVFSPGTEIFVGNIEVTLPQAPPGATYRITLDGTHPTAQSQAYNGPLAVSATTQIRAKLYRGDQPIGEENYHNYQRVMPMPSIPHQEAGKPGLRFRVFEGEWDRLPDFGTLIPTKLGECANIDLNERTAEDRFAMQFDGMINVPKADVYTFYLGSDDGSRLLIDGQPILDNDGLHSFVERKVTVPLDQGRHRFQVQFFEKTGGETLEVQVESIAQPKGPIPNSWLEH